MMQFRPREYVQSHRYNVIVNPVYSKLTIKTKQPQCRWSGALSATIL